METLPELLQARVTSAVRQIAPDVSVPVSVSAATDVRFGDYQTNVAMLLAKALRANPRQIATELITKLEVAELCEPPEVAGAGFINFRIRPEVVANRAAAMLTDERLGVALQESKKRVVIDFSGPNVAKPMHVGHIRSTILGDAITRIGRFLGHEIIADNHLGDWGTQFGKVIYGWKTMLDHEALAREPVQELVRLYREVNALCERDPAVLEACRQELVKLQRGEPSSVVIWSRTCELSRQEFESIYRLLDVHFDEWLGESAYNSRLAPLVDRLLASGVAQISEGAVCVFFPDHPSLTDKPCIIRKQDGGYLYATTDLATVEYREERWQPDENWYVVGAPQALHFEQIFTIAQRLGAKAQFRFIPFGSILGEDRKLMKTRSGDNVSLRELLDEAQQRALRIVEEKNAALPEAEKLEIARIIGLGAVKYADLSQARMTDYVFSWERMLSLQGNTAPYLQNAYVRIQSIFRKLEGGGSQASEISLREPAELALGKKLLLFAETVPQVLDDFRPNILATYLYELANTFHGFYEACPVLKAEEPTRSSRLALCALTARVLKQGLSLLGIGVPERM